MKRSFLCTTIAGLAALALSAVPALSADSGSVNLSITVATPCILVAPDTVTFDSAPFSASDALPSKSVARHAHQVQNCSQKSEPLFAKATNATGSAGATWMLVDQAVGPNRYMLQLDNQVLTGIDQAVSSGPLLVGEGRPVDLTLWMPTVGSSGAGQTMSMSVTYTATF